MMAFNTTILSCYDYVRLTVQKHLKDSQAENACLAVFEVFPQFNQTKFQ